MNPQDARVRYTRSVIEEQFLAQLREKPLNQITVKELCQRCGINRATFYKHYQDIYDLMLTLEETVLERMRDFLSIMTASNLEECISALLYYSKYAERKWLPLFSEHGDPALAERMFRLSQEMVPDGLEEKLSRLTPEERELALTYIRQGSSALMASWIRSDGTLSPERAAKLILTCSGAVVKRFS